MVQAGSAVKLDLRLAEADEDGEDHGSTWVRGTDIFETVNWYPAIILQLCHTC